MRDEREIITVWVTRHALTAGILRIEGAEVCSDINEHMIKTPTRGCFHGRDWHRTEEAAVKRAEEMRVSKISKLRQQISKLDKLRFGTGLSL